MTIKLETFEDAMNFVIDSHGWECGVCLDYIPPDTDEVLAHLRTHSQEELKQYLKGEE